MKIYKQSFWRANTTQTRFIPMFVGLVLSLLIINPKNLVYHSIIWLISGLFLFLILMAFTQYFYVILTEDALIVHNYIYRWWKKTYPYKDIKSIEIGNTGGFTNDYIRVFSDNKKSFRYVIDLVGRKNNSKLIHDLKSRNIIVDIKK